MGQGQTHHALLLFSTSIADMRELSYLISNQCVLFTCFAITFRVILLDTQTLEAT